MFSLEVFLNDEVIRWLLVPLIWKYFWSCFGGNPVICLQANEISQIYILVDLQLPKFCYLQNFSLKPFSKILIQFEFFSIKDILKEFLSIFYLKDNASKFCSYW